MLLFFFFHSDRIDLYVCVCVCGSKRRRKILLKDSDTFDHDLILQADINSIATLQFFSFILYFFFLQFKISVLLLFPFQQLLLIFPTIIFLLAITLFLCCSQQCQTPTVRTADSLFLTISKTSYSGTCLLYILPNYFFFYFSSCIFFLFFFFFLRIKASVNQIIIKG